MVSVVASVHYMSVKCIPRGKTSALRFFPSFFRESSSFLLHGWQWVGRPGAYESRAHPCKCGRLCNDAGLRKMLMLCARERGLDGGPIRPGDAGGRGINSQGSLDWETYFEVVEKIK